MCGWHGEVDPAIRGHGEPHVVRVGVDGALRVAVCVKVLLVSGSFNLSEDFDVLVWPCAAPRREQRDVNEHFPGSRGDDTGDDVRRSPNVLEFIKANVMKPSFGHRSPLVWAVWWHCRGSRGGRRGSRGET